MIDIVGIADRSLERDHLSQPLANGGAVCTVSYPSTATHSITARYSGDANFGGSTSQPETVSVVPIPANAAGIIAATIEMGIILWMARC